MIYSSICYGLGSSCRSWTTAKHSVCYWCQLVCHSVSNVRPDKSDTNEYTCRWLKLFDDTKLNTQLVGRDSISFFDKVTQIVNNRRLLQAFINSISSLKFNTEKLKWQKYPEWIHTSYCKRFFLGYITLQWTKHLQFVKRKTKLIHSPGRCPWISTDYHAAIELNSHDCRLRKRHKLDSIHTEKAWRQN